MLHVYQDILDAATRGNPRQTVHGMSRIVLEDGKPVNRLAKGEYQIVHTGTVVRTSAADAP